MNDLPMQEYAKNQSTRQTQRAAVNLKGTAKDRSKAKRETGFEDLNKLIDKSDSSGRGSNLSESIVRSPSNPEDTF